MKKRWLAVLLMGVMVLSLAGCGESEDGDSGSSGGTSIEASADENGNYAVNGSFEDDFETLADWTITLNETEEVDLYTRETDCYDGVQCMHFWSGETDVDFTAEQTLSGLEAGTYTLTGYIQGEATATDTEIYFYAVIDGETYQIDTSLDGYLTWNEAVLSGLEVEGGEITIGVCVKAAAESWGTIDDITLVKE